ncbi:MAG: amidohydrolase [Bacteroidota bacterium]|nr:amidohydrolase [Bacteroidota bacterium]MDE2956979.1 amidohydrolase [Bacteroidota bacterium]
MSSSVVEPAVYTDTQSGSLNGLDLPDEFLTYLLQLRRHFHRYPEVGYDEHATSRTIRTHLESQGLEVQGPVAQTGMFVDIHGHRPGPHVGYRCDMDALPLADAKKVSYSSKNNGVTHACGHDAHITIGLGVALTLNRLRESLEGSVRVFFQPNEEGDPSGSLPMIESGLCDPLSAVYCIHVDPTLDLGQFGIQAGQVTAASDRLRVNVRAQTTGHSARPHEVRDTIWIATQLLNQFYQLVGRVTDARLPAVYTACRFQGGNAHNVIPSEVSFEGTLRTLHTKSRARLLDYMEETARRMAQLHDVSIRLVRVGWLPSLVNHPLLCENVHRCVRSLHGEEAAIRISVPSMGSEDFAHYVQLIPGMLVRVGTRSGASTAYPLHDAHFDLDERALGPAVSLMTQVLLRHCRKQIID